MPVYIIHAGDTRMVKIGWADEDVEARRRDLQSAHYQVLRVVRVIDGPRSVEGWMHRAFAARRGIGEWFKFHPEMLTVEPPAMVPLPPATIIDQLGGAPALAALLNLAPSTVGNWRARGSIPARYHHAVIVASNGTISAEDIIRAHAQQPSEPPAFDQPRQQAAAA